MILSSLQATPLPPTRLDMQKHVVFWGSVVGAPPFDAIWRRLAALYFLGGSRVFAEKRGFASTRALFLKIVKIGLAKDVSS